MNDFASGMYVGACFAALAAYIVHLIREGIRHRAKLRQIKEEDVERRLRELEARR